jgi:hypothetical protein
LGRSKDQLTYAGVGTFQQNAGNAYFVGDEGAALI